MLVKKKDNFLKIIKMQILEIIIIRLNYLNKGVKNLVKYKIHPLINLSPIIILKFEIQMKIFKI